VKQHVGMKLPIAGKKVFLDEIEDEPGLVVGVKGFGIFGKESELLFEKFDGTVSGAAGILIGWSESAEQKIERLKELRITLSRREV